MTVKKQNNNVADICVLPFARSINGDIGNFVGDSIKMLLSELKKNSPNEGTNGTVNFWGKESRVSCLTYVSGDIVMHLSNERRNISSYN